MSIFKHLFFNQCWYVAYRTISFEEPLPQVSKKYLYTIVPTKKNTWIADPFLFKVQDKMYLICELTNIKKSKAVIGAKELFNKKVYVEPILEYPGHLSYPCIFEKENQIFMIPETEYLNQVVLLKNNVWPNKWTQEKILMQKIKAADSTFFLNNGEPSIFIYENSPMKKLHLYTMKNENCVLLKSYESNNGRPAGKTLHLNGKDIRVAQPCLKFYGEKVEFLAYSLNGNNYFEKKIGEISKENIILDKKIKICGVHTFNRLENVEVIDILSYKFDLLKPLKTLLKKIGIFGYDFADLRNKKIYG